jgi:hypothetical protein
MSKGGLEFIQYTVKQIVQAPGPSENRFSMESNILLGKMMRTWYGNYLYIVRWEKKVG